MTYVRIMRNIYQKGERIQVKLTRRGLNKGRHLCKTFDLDKLEAAMRWRDEQEFVFHKLKPWDQTPQRRFRKTSRQLRNERRAAGLCPSCGEAPPAPNRRLCHDCLQTASIKYHNRKEQNALQAM